MAATNEPTPMNPRIALGFEMGRKIKTLREEKGYTQRYVAESIGVTDTAVGNIENRGAIPGGETLMYLALTLGCTVDDLYPDRYIERFGAPPLEQRGRRAESLPASASANGGTSGNAASGQRRSSKKSSDSTAAKPKTKKVVRLAKAKPAAAGREGGVSTTLDLPAALLAEAA